MELSTSRATLTADHPAFGSALADLSAAADRLRADRDRVERQVDVLLDGGWSGAAAQAYAESWSQWCAGAERVLDGLVTMRRLLAAVHDDLTERDLDSRAALDRLTARLG